MYFFLHYHITLLFKALLTKLQLFSSIRTCFLLPLQLEIVHVFDLFTFPTHPLNMSFRGLLLNSNHMIIRGSKLVTMVNAVEFEIKISEWCPELRQMCVVYDGLMEIIIIKCPANWYKYSIFYVSLHLAISACRRSSADSFLCQDKWLSKILSHCLHLLWLPFHKSVKMSQFIQVSLLLWAKKLLFLSYFCDKLPLRLSFFQNN